MTRPKVQLVLKSADINKTIQSYTAGGGPTEPTDATYTNSNGDYINKNRTDMKFNNMNLRSILSPIFERGCKYMLRLESITFHLSSNLTYFSTFENDRCYNIYMSGFPFMKSWNNGSMNNSILLASIRVPSGAQAYTYTFNNDNEFTFEILETQNNYIFPITIQLRDQLTNLIEPSSNLTVAIPNSQYVFSIYKI